ncbi:MAG: hypothetical protein LBN42_00395 [Oscillospiraceae bacterium]|jgi:hypothetical protein|nr:hypothetical protein [Oscillospiraceae bacterium]
MKLSKPVQATLLFLIAVAITVVSTFMFIKPALEKFKETDDAIAVKKKEISEVKGERQEEIDNVALYKNLVKNVSEAEKYFWDEMGLADKSDVPGIITTYWGTVIDGFNASVGAGEEIVERPEFENKSVTYSSDIGSTALGIQNFTESNPVYGMRAATLRKVVDSQVTAAATEGQVADVLRVVLKNLGIGWTELSYSDKGTEAQAIGEAATLAVLQLAYQREFYDASSDITYEEHYTEIYGADKANSEGLITIADSPAYKAYLFEFARWYLEAEKAEPGSLTYSFKFVAKDNTTALKFIDYVNDYNRAMSVTLTPGYSADIAAPGVNQKIEYDVSITLYVVKYFDVPADPNKAEQLEEYFGKPAIDGVQPEDNGVWNEFEKNAAEK